jgi:hypothetical protein
MVQSDTLNANVFSCTDHVNFNVRVFNMSNVATIVSKAVTTSTQMTQATQTAVADITQEVKSLAKGLDPTAMIVIAVVVVVALIGAGMFGLNKVANVMLSLQFWFIVSLLAALGATAVDLIRLGGTSIWPYKKDDADRNRAILIISSIVGGAALLATGATGFMLVKNKNSSNPSTAAPKSLTF